MDVALPSVLQTKVLIFVAFDEKEVNLLIRIGLLRQRNFILMPFMLQFIHNDKEHRKRIKWNHSNIAWMASPGLFSEFMVKKKKKSFWLIFQILPQINAGQACVGLSGVPCSDEGLSWRNAAFVRCRNNNDDFPHWKKFKWISFFGK